MPLKNIKTVANTAYEYAKDQWIKRERNIN